MKRKKTLSLLIFLLSLVMTLGLMMPVLAAQRNGLYEDPTKQYAEEPAEVRLPGGLPTGEYGSQKIEICYIVRHERNCIKHIAIPSEAPVFIDPDTEIKWIAVDSRLCEHGGWGIDILYRPENSDLGLEPIWVCHGSLTMDEYSRVYGCCDYKLSDVYAVGIEAFNNRPCDRTGCFGSMIQTGTFTRWGRVYQRICTQRPWGVDILYVRYEMLSLICNMCNAMGPTASLRREDWRCYGFF